METKDIQKLLEFISKTDLDEVNIETDELKLLVKRKSEQATQVVAAAPVVAQAPAAAPIATAQPTAPATEAAAPAEPAASNLIEIKSPMIGTFYRAASPDKPPFVEIGDDISAGKVICVLEAMKLFNEIEAEVSGKIVKVLVEDATPVEYDQPLFLVEPN